MGKIYEDITKTVGRTPLVRLNRLTEGAVATVLAKLESFNPLSSVKDRIGVAMIEDAEKRGLLKKGSVIIEPTSGNTGIGLAFVAAAKGYRLILAMPETMSLERRQLLKIFGAELVLTEGAKGMKGAIDKAEELAQRPPIASCRSSSTTPPTPKSTARRRPRKSGATPTARWTSWCRAWARAVPSRVWRRSSRSAKPPSRPSPWNRTRRRFFPEAPRAPTRSKALGAGFVPAVLNREIIDEVIRVTNEDAGETARQLAKKEGILAGISCGAALWAALQVAKRPENKGKLIVVILPDTGERYLSTWLFEEAKG